MRVIVTGCCGFVGSALTKLLTTLGVEVIGIDNFDETYSPKLKEYRYNQIKSLSNFDFVRGSIFFLHHMGVEADGIIHLAARAGVSQSVKNPEKYWYWNISDCADTLEWARKKSGRWWLFASSSSVYSGLPAPHTEDLRLTPSTPYAATKLMGEMMGENYARLYGVDGMALRLFSVYGPAGRPDSRASVYRWTEQLLNHQTVTVGDAPQSRRDFTYIDDVVMAFWQAANVLQEHSTTWDVINIGNSDPQPLATVVDKLATLCDYKNYRVEYGDLQTPLTWATNDKAKSILNWKAQTSLEQGLFETVEWHKEYMNW